MARKSPNSIKMLLFLAIFQICVLGDPNGWLGYSGQSGERPMMVLANEENQVSVVGYDQLENVLRTHAGKTETYVFVGASWCYDTRTAQPVVKAQLRYLKSTELFIWVDIGLEKFEWRQRKSQFQTELDVVRLPTIIRMSDRGQLVERDCCDENKVEKFVNCESGLREDSIHEPAEQLTSTVDSDSSDQPTTDHNEQSESEAAELNDTSRDNAQEGEQDKVKFRGTEKRKSKNGKKPATEISVIAYDELQHVLNTEKDKTETFVFVGATWCYDTIVAKPVVKKQLKVLKPTELFIWADIGMNMAQWRGHNSKFQTELKVERLPTIVQMSDRAQLVENDCKDSEKVKEFLSHDGSDGKKRTTETHTETYKHATKGADQLSLVGYHDLKQALDANIGRRETFVFVGATWCYDTVEAKPVVQRQLEMLNSNELFIWADIGMDIYKWRRQTSNFQTDLKVERLPTIIRVSNGIMLVEADCRDATKVKKFFSRNRPASIMKMVGSNEISVIGFHNLQHALAAQHNRSETFVFVGATWCYDTHMAKPVVEGEVKFLKSTELMIWADIGMNQAEWRRRTSGFRTQMNILKLPTIVRISDSAHLVERDCCDQDKVRKFFKIGKKKPNTSHKGKGKSCGIM